MSYHIGDATKVTWDFDRTKECIETRRESYHGSYANNDITRPIAPENQHCWHDSGVRYSTYPVQKVYRCCYCDLPAQVTTRKNAEGHGEFHPEKLREKYIKPPSLRK